MGGWQNQKIKPVQSAKDRPTAALQLSSLSCMASFAASRFNQTSPQLTRKNGTFDRFGGVAYMSYCLTKTLVHGLARNRRAAASIASLWKADSRIATR
jgi:hypothetical protein